MTETRPSAFQRSSSYVKSEAAEYKEAVKEIWVFTRTHQWKASIKHAFRRKYWAWWALLVFTIVTSTLLSQYHAEIITAIKPYKALIRRTPAVWLVPVVVLIIVSFPPLFGHELIILVCGVIYSIPVAFAIACAGTFLGELALFYAAKSLLSKRARKVETKSVVYACLARLMREGGVKTSILVRFSAVPGHITTAIQSTIGISVWVYAIAAIVSLPKQFALVYVGYVFGQSAIPLEEWQATHPGESDAIYYAIDSTASQRRKISFIVFAATFFATAIAFVFIWMQIRKIRPSVVAEMERNRLRVERKKARTSTSTDGGDEELEEIVGRKQEASDVGEAKLEFGNGTTHVDHRASYSIRDSSPSGYYYTNDSTRIGLLAAAGGVSGRAGSSIGDRSSLGSLGYSPSLPHLPLPLPIMGPDDEEEEYFNQTLMAERFTSRRTSH